MTMQGRFTRLALGNWRNFKRVDVRLQHRVFVVGPNASGKSNLLDAFRFLQELAVEGGGLTNALEGTNRGGLRAVRSLHAGGNPRVTIAVDAEIDGAPWTYELELKAEGTPQKPGPARIVKERVTHNDSAVLERPNEPDDNDPELLLATALEQRSANAGFRPLRDFMRSAEYIHVVPQLVRMPAQGDTRRFGKGLGTGLIGAMGEVPKKTRDARLKRIQRALKSVLPQFEALEWFQDGRGVPHIRAKYKHWRPKGAWQQESSFSDGTLRLIGLLWYLAEAGGPLLLEEPEMSLRSRRGTAAPPRFGKRGIAARATGRHHEPFTRPRGRQGHRAFGAPAAADDRVGDNGDRGKRVARARRGGARRHAPRGPCRGAYAAR